MKRTLISIIPLILLNISINAQQDFWGQTNGPKGGFVQAMAVNSSGDIFVGTETGVFRSTDEGENWNEINNGLPSFFYNRYVESLAINSKGFIFMGTVIDGIFRSTDNGNSWTAIGNGIIGECKSLTVNSDGNIFACITNAGIFRSTDDGENWTNINVFIPGSTEKLYNAVVINSKGDIFVGFTGNGGGIVVSTDNGKNWTQNNWDYIQSMTICSNDFIFAETLGGGVLRSTDNGESWITANNGLTDSVSIGTFVPSLTADSKGNLFAIAYNQKSEGEPFTLKIFRSTDYGNSWLERSNGIPDDFLGNIFGSIIINNNDDVFAGMAGFGVFCSTDNGENWTERNSGLNNSDINSLLINIQGNIFAIASSNGIYRSSNNGAQWVKIFGSDPRVNSIVTNQKGDIFIANNVKGIFRSIDGGNTWAQINNGLSSTEINALAISPNGNLFAGISAFDGEIFFSSDNGESWNNTGHIFEHSRWSFCFAFNSSGYIFAGTGEGIYRSTDNGVNWTEIDSGLTDNNVQSILINSQNYLFIGTQSGVFRSTDNGNSWDEVNYGLNNTYIECMTSNSDGDLFVGNLDGIFQLRRNSNNWIDINNNLDNLSVHSLAFNSDNILFCGTSDGVFHTTSSITSVEDKKAIFIKTFELYQNYPNPFNPSTKISYSIPKLGFVTLKVYDILGREVGNLVNEEKNAGNYEVEFNGNNLSSGIYIYKLQVGNYHSVKKMLLIK